MDGGPLAWIVVWLLAVVLNAIPVFMPPPWSLLAYFHLRHDLAVLPLAVTGALAAMTGRTILALASRRLGVRWLSPQRQASIEALRAQLLAHRGLSLSSLALFSIGPIPTNHLFIAAGLARVPLLPVVLVFGVTRCVSYVLWMQATETAAASLADVVTPTLGSGAAVALQLLGFALLILLVRLDWTRIVARWLARHGQGGRPTSA